MLGACSDQGGNICMHGHGRGSFTHVALAKGYFGVEFMGYLHAWPGKGVL